MLNIILQSFIFLLGASSIWFIAQKKPWSRWGYIFGLASQPFWLISSLENKQYGIAILSLVYGYSWSIGIYNYWIKK